MAKRNQLTPRPFKGLTPRYIGRQSSKSACNKLNSYKTLWIKTISTNNY